MAKTRAHYVCRLARKSGARGSWPCRQSRKRSPVQVFELRQLDLPNSSFPFLLRGARTQWCAQPSLRGQESSMTLSVLRTSDDPEVIGKCGVLVRWRLGTMPAV